MIASHVRDGSVKVKVEQNLVRSLLLLLIDCRSLVDFNKLVEVEKRGLVDNPNKVNVAAKFRHTAILCLEKPPLSFVALHYSLGPVITANVFFRAYSQSW